VKIHEISLSQDLLRTMAETLWSAMPPSDLPDCLILLPSSRACRTLEHVLLDLARERDGLAALLLPRITTLTQWSEAAAALAGVDLDNLPDPRVRPLVLAPRLATLPWLKEHPASAAGMAEEFITLFDEARLEECDGRLLREGGGADADADAWAGAGPDAEATAADVRRIREVWQLYRGLVRRDRVDAMVDLASRIGGPQEVDMPRSALVMAGGFGRLDRIEAKLLQAALDCGDQAQLFLPDAGGDDHLDRAFCATWSDPAGTDGTGPFGPAARLRRGLSPAGGPPLDAAPAKPAPLSLRERLEAARRENGSPDARARITLASCADPETEARFVVDRVVQHLRAAGEDPEPLAVATPDPRLASRILAMLQDAGIEADNTLGRPLASQPAGLLMRFMLRTALTGLRAEPLLEVLTHPFVSLPVARGAHPVWTLRLEKLFRRDDAPQMGLAGLGRHAAERDQVVRDLFGTTEPGMVEFVGLIEDAFAPLLELAGRPHATWSEHVAACRASWRALTEGGAGSRNEERQDETALQGIWEMLEANAALLDPLSLADFAATSGRLLAAEMVVPHRPRNLPVMVTGLVEMRLEQRANLILAGLREDVFPAPAPPRFLMTPGARSRLGLPGWREHLGLEAELMLRLLNNGVRVTVTWPTEEGGQPVLPSPLVSRLALALDRPAEVDAEAPVAAIPLWRSAAAAEDEISAAQLAFMVDPRPTRALVPCRAQNQLSWTALRQWRECPYRFLMERRFALSREEDLRREFSRMDYGSLVHGALYDFLAPGGEGLRRLESGDETGALAALDAAADARFSPGSEELPVRRLWLDSFRRVIPAVVSTELARLQTWRPHLLEQKFAAPLEVLVDGTQGRCAGLEGPQFQPSGGWEAARERSCGIVLRGTLDRLDQSRRDPAETAVLDYKTGLVPTAGRVGKLEDLQIILYAAAVEAGVVDPDLQGVKVVEGSYYRLQEGEAGPPAKPHLPGASDEGRQLLAAGMVRLIELALEAAATGAVYPVLAEEARAASASGLPCRTCDLRGVCRIEEERGRPGYPPGLWLGLDGIIHQREGAF